MTFGKEFTRAVEQKQIAQQDAERARFIVEKAEQERQANVIRAEGEAESADTISKAVAKAGDGLIMIRRIEASREIAQTLASNPNVTYLPGGGENGSQCRQEIEEEVEKLARTGQEIKRFSLIGYSLGGLVARYAVGLLDSKGFFEKITPVVRLQPASAHETH